jgi:hypothetical protein
MQQPLANTLTLDEVRLVYMQMKQKRQLYPGPRGLVCNLKPNKPGGYPQVDCKLVTRGRVTTKVLVHHIVWRHRTQLDIDSSPLLHISHLDADKAYVEAVQESAAMNESRKYCHLFGWYARLKGDDRARCPHFEHPCSGPLRPEHADSL